MTMCTPTGASASASTVPLTAMSCGGVGTAPSATLLPTPDIHDNLEALYGLFADSNLEDTKAAKTNVEVRSSEKKVHRREQQAALERAREAAEEESSFLDSMGLGSLAGIVMANPALVIADMSMHMAKLTPDALRNFEKDNKDSIELATKVYCGVTNAALLGQGIQDPESLRAALALGGLMIQETEVFGKEDSAWIGTALVVGCSNDARAAAIVVAAEKDGAVADEIRHIDRETKDYTKWVALAGMAAAAAGAIVATAGAATPVVAIGVGLSVAGFVVQETKCLDELIGKNASMWIGSGMMLGGALISGAGAAGIAQQASQAAQQTAQTVGRAMTVAGGVMNGAATTRQGLEKTHDAAVQYEVDKAHHDANKHRFQLERAQRMVDEIIETVRDLKDGHRRMSQAVNEAIEIQCQTQLNAASMRV